MFTSCFFLEKEIKPNKKRNDKRKPGKTALSPTTCLFNDFHFPTKALPYRKVEYEGGKI